MTELEYFAKQTLEQGGEWYKLEGEFCKGGLYVSKTKYLVKNNYYYNSPVYQVFNNEGKRIMATTNYNSAYSYYIKNVKKEVII